MSRTFLFGRSFDMKNIYKNFNEEELIIAYNELLDNSGKINSDMQEILNDKGYKEEFFAKANHKKAVVKEKGRVAFEISKMVDQNESLENVNEKITSDILGKDELSYFILEKYIAFEHNRENSKVDKETLYKSFVGLIVGTFAGILFLLLIILFLQAFVFFFLVPTYIVCYLVIKLITGKTRTNLAVFISTFLATVLSALLVFIIFRLSIAD